MANLPTCTTEYKLASSWKDIRRVVRQCRQTGYCSHDFETNALPFHSTGGYPTTISLSFQPGFSLVIPLGHSESVFKDEYVKILQYLDKHLFRNPDVIKVVFNAKFEHKWLMRYGCNYRGKVIDVMLLKYLLNEERPNDLKSLTAKFYPQLWGYDEDIDKQAKKIGWGNIPLEELAKYNAIDSNVTLRLGIMLERKVTELGFYKLFWNLAMQQSQVLADSEFRGIPVDKAYLDRTIKEFRDKLDNIDSELRNNPIVRRYEKKRIKKTFKALIKAANQAIEERLEMGHDTDSRVIKNWYKKIENYSKGLTTTKKDAKSVEPFNFNSPAQLIDLFFQSKHGFGFDVVKYTRDKNKNPTDRPSTAEDVLLELKNQDDSNFMDKLLELRGTQKLYSTYLVGVREKLSERDHIHTSFLIHGTVTGRLSSRNPNLQNIPRATTSAFIKKQFVPPPGFLLLEVDYSQAELRVVAEIAKEKSMIDAFKRGWSIHVFSGAKMAGWDYEDMYKATKDESHPRHEEAVKQKKKGKVINFSILYEQGDPMTAEALGVTVADAKRFKEEWFSLFPGVRKWRKQQHKMAKERGYVVNLFGRKRRLMNASSSNPGLQAEALRQSVNAPIQGCSSDFTQFSSVLIREMRLAGELPSYFKQIYTVHDSLGFPVKGEDVHWILDKIMPVCANPQTQKWFGFKMKHVEMKVSAEVGPTWGEYHDYDQNEDYSKWKTHS